LSSLYNQEKRRNIRNYAELTMYFSFYPRVCAFCSLSFFYTVNWWIVTFINTV